MLDYTELCKYFTKDQMQDLLDLEIICEQTPPGRIRRNRVRKIRPDHIPRPVNSFMTYRTEKQFLIRKFCPTANHREISRIVAKWWHNISNSEKSNYVDQAKAAKVAHKQMYPDYIFRPKAKRVTSKNPTDVKKVHTNESTRVKSAVSKQNTSPQTSLIQTSSAPLANYDVNNYLGTQHIKSSNINFNNCNFDAFENTMYLDEVLFKSTEDDNNHLNYWSPSNTRSIPSTVPDLNQADQEAFYGELSSYFPNPIDRSLANQPVDQLGVMTSVDRNTCDPAFISNSTYSQPLYAFPSFETDITSKNQVTSALITTYATPLLENEITPQSQAMSTPKLSYPGTPFFMTEMATTTNNHDILSIDLQQTPSCLFNNYMLPGEVQSSSNPTISNIDPTLLEDFSFLENFNN